MSNRDLERLDAEDAAAKKQLWHRWFGSDRGAVCTDNGGRARDQAVREGRLQESVDGSGSAYSYEDLPSDFFGADFGANHFDTKSKKSLAEQIDAYLQGLGATTPDEAPNWGQVPSGDPRDLPSNPPRNETTTPMFTKK